MPNYPISEGQDVIVYAKCSMDHCINHQLNYKPVYSWEPIKFTPNCGGDIAVTVVLFIITPVLIIMGTILAIVVGGYFVFVGSYILFESIYSS